MPTNTFPSREGGGDGARGYWKSASCSLQTQPGQPPALDMARERPPPPLSFLVFSQIFRQGLYLFKSSGLEKEMSVKMPL